MTTMRRDFGGKSKNKGHRRDFGRRKPKRHEKAQKIGEGVLRIGPKRDGFVMLSEKNEVRIDNARLNTALHGDMVRVANREVASIIKRAKDFFVGTLEGSTIAPDDRRFYPEVILFDNKANAAPGEKVIFKIFKWEKGKAFARTTEKLGKRGEHETEIKSIIAGAGIVYNFSDQVEKEAKEVVSFLNRGSGEARRDMRGTVTFTIDPADAKDFDDAVSIREMGGGKFEIGVHIADVSYFVRPGTALDREAADRANSTYLVDRTLPMLPEILSADVCSLVPDQDRLTYSAIFTMDKNGKVYDEWFGRTIIHSNKRFTYEEAAKVLELKSGPYQHELEILNEIAVRLHGERLKKGSIIFDKDEVRVEMDKDMRPTRIYVKERLATHKLIEEFMLLANRHVAHFLFRHVEKRGGGAMYRIHDAPNKERIALLKTYLATLGYHIEGWPNSASWRIGAKEINALFSQIKGEDIESLVQTAVLRSMAKAVYSTQNIGHFGLGFEFYTHFTSPIRRYPDLIVHRLLTKYLAGKSLSKEELLNFDRIARYSSEKERESEVAERESIKFKQAEFMFAHLGRGETFEGTITGVTEWGMFVEEKNTKSEGMVRLSSLGDDYYEFNEKKFALIGNRTKKTFRLGDKVGIKLATVDIPRHQITWQLAT